MFFRREEEDYEKTKLLDKEDWIRIVAIVTLIVGIILLGVIF